MARFRRAQKLAGGVNQLFNFALETLEVKSVQVQAKCVFRYQFTAIFMNSLFVVQ